jgi:hypothetical protein
VLPPLLKSVHNCGDDWWGGVECCEVGLEFLRCQGKGELGAYAFAFHHVPRELIRVSTSRTAGVIFIAPQKLTSSDATESGSMFDKPACFSQSAIVPLRLRMLPN